MAIKELDPVREYQGDPRRLAGSVLTELESMRAQLVEEIGTIQCTTFEEYRNRFGKIEGIDIAISICKQVQKKLEA
jgi:hypothetical protein